MNGLSARVSHEAKFWLHINVKIKVLRGRSLHKISILQKTLHQYSPRKAILKRAHEMWFHFNAIKSYLHIPIDIDRFQLIAFIRMITAFWLIVGEGWIHYYVLIIGFCILLRVILTVNNNTFCFATIDKVFINRSYLIKTLSIVAKQKVLLFTVNIIMCLRKRKPPLWSSGQSSWLQIQRSGLDSRRYQIFWEVVR
jgi:hypothetical protein